MTSAQLAALLAAVGLAFLAQSITSALLFRRVRTVTERLASGRPVPPDLSPLRAVEARLDRLEAAAGVTDRVAAAAGEPRQPVRVDRRPLGAAEGPVLIAVPNLALAPTSPDAEAGAELDRRFGGIWGLADSGLDAEQIAREAGVPVGQVELILGLRGLQAGGEPTRDGHDG